MLYIPIHVIAFFMGIMMVPEDVNQFTIDVQGKKIEWTRQDAGWRAVELPRDDQGMFSVNGSEITITGEGHKLKTNISRFLSMPENLDWKKATEIQVALKSLGDPVQIQREDGKIVLSQAKGELFEKPVTISWKMPEKKIASPQRSLLRFPKATIHADFLQPSRCTWTIPVAKHHTSRDNQIIAHRGEANGIATPERASASLHWEFIGQSHWAHGDVYLLKFSDPAKPGASWVKTVVYNGSPVEVVNSTDICIKINESGQVEQQTEGNKVRR